MSILKYEREIGVLLRSSGAKRVLDYGCGLGLQYKKARLHEKWGIPSPECYDPGVLARSAKPAGTFEAVLCSDVMEHVPEDLVDAVLEEIFGYAEKWVWMSICCRPAKKFFDDGRNLHLTVKKDRWWISKVRKASRGKSHHIVFTP